MESRFDQSKSSVGSSESRLKAILETAIDGIVTINDQGVIETVNPAVENIFGYSDKELIGQNVKILMPEPYAKQHDGFLERYLETGEKKIIGIGREVEGKRKDGSIFHMHLSVSEMEVDGQRMFTGIVRNISRRIEAEKALLAREQRIRTLVETIPDGVIVINKKGNVETFNPAAERIFGYSASEVISKNIKIFLPKSFSEKSDVHIQQLLNKGVGKIFGVVRELVGRRKDDTTFPMELTVSEMWVDGEHLFNAIVRDISERKAAEITEGRKHVLETTAAFERTHSEIMTFFSTSYDTEKVFKSTLDLLGENHNFLVSAVFLSDEWHGELKCVASYGMSEGFKRRISPENGLIGEVARSGKSIIITSSDEMPFNIDVGFFNIVPAAVLLIPLCYREKVLGVLTLATTREVEEIELGFLERLASQIGASLHNLNQYQNMKILSDQLRQRGQEISHKNKLLEQANRLKTEFLANMSHELRTPLNAIIGFSEVLADKVQGELNEVQADYIDEILSSASHLLSLINDILDLSKVEAGKMELYLEPLNISEMLHNSLSVVKEQALSRKINLNLEISESVGEILVADTRKLKQVIFNLLSNAVKFTGEGGSVNIEVDRQENDFRVKVIDTGIGIAENNIALLFSPFEQLDGSLSRQYEGTGLGLALVKRLVELHGGSVGVDSVKGEGSCFYFTIPYRTPDDLEPEKQENPLGLVSPQLCSPKLTPPEESSQFEKTVLPSPMVLIIENNDQAAHSMAKQLENIGYSTRIYSHFFEALKIAKALLPDLIIIDILMPGVESLEAIKLLKSDAALKHIPLLKVALSTNPQKGINLGVLEIVDNPDDKQELLESLVRAVPDRVNSDTKVLLVDEKKSLQLMLDKLDGLGFVAMGATEVIQAINLAHHKSPDVIILNLFMEDSVGFDLLLSLRSSDQLQNIPVIIYAQEQLSDHAKEKLYSHGLSLLDKYHFDFESLIDDVERKLPISASLNEIHEKYKILIIEDDQNQAALLKLFLEDAGYQITLASNGYEAIECLKNDLPDLISLDLLMPEMDGFAFLEIKGNTPEYAAIPMIVLSSVTEQMEDLPLVADAVLRKPLQRNDMLRLIKNILPPVDSENDLPKPKLLLIDDDPKAINIISSFLPQHQYEVISAFNGTDGIELARMERPDLIVLDLLMPEVSGFDVLTALKQDSETRNIPVFILTAKVLSNEEHHRLTTLVEAVALKKNASRQLLVNEISKILERHNSI